MNMSFGVAAAPPAPGEIGGADPLPASSLGASSMPLPPVPAPFSLPSASFTFQGTSANLMPPSRPPSAPSAGFQFAGGPPRFIYPNLPTNVPSAVPPSASPAPPFSMQPGFTFQGQSGNPFSSPGQPILGLTNLQPGAVGRSPVVVMRPFQPTAMQASVSTPAQSGHGAGPPPPPSQVSGTGASTEASPGTPPGGFPLPGTQARPIVPPTTVVPSMTGLPGQTQITTIPPPIGAVTAARPGLGLPTSTAVPFAPTRPAFAANPGAAAAIVPPGAVLSYCFGEAAKLLTLVENIKHLL